MIDTMRPAWSQTSALQPDDDFLLDDGLPCLRRDGKLYYLTDVQPRVLEACRHFDISFDQLAEKLGMTRPTMVLILKGYDPVSPQLKSMIDRLLGQVGLLPPLPSDCVAGTAAAHAAAPVTTTIHAVPVPEPAITVVAEAVSDQGEDAPIPQPLTPGRPAAAVPPISPVVFTAGLPDFTPGLRRVPRRRRPQPAPR